MRGLRVAATVFAAAALAIAAGVAPAAAATDVLVSADGETFAPALAESLFDQAGALVPGESITAELWITNPEPRDAVMRIGVHDVAVTSTDFSENVTMGVSDSGTGSTREFALSDLSDCQTLVPSHIVAAGATERMLVVLSMDEAVTGLTGQGDAGRFDLGIAMRDAAGGDLSADACDSNATVVPVTSAPTAAASPRARAVAYTGGELPVPVVVVASALIGAGLLLVTRRRRRDPDGDSRVG